MKPYHCSRCGNPGHYARTCGTGAKSSNAARKTLRARRKAAGLCRDCGAPLAPLSGLYCEGHLEAALAYAREYGRKWRANT